MKKKDFLQVLISIVILYGLFFVLGIGCPIRFLTGVSCAGCGMTRAWINLLEGHIGKAFYYHPLFWTVPILFILSISNPKQKVWKRLQKIAFIVLVVMFGLVYVIRLMSSDHTIVSADVTTGAIWRVVQYILERGRML